MSRRVLTLAVCSLMAFCGSVFAQVPSDGFVNMIDPLHLAAPDQAKAVEWYHQHFNAQITPEGTDRAMFGQTRMIFQKNESPKPSEGSVLDLIGFSVANLNATMKQLQSAGVKVVMPPMTMEGMKVAQV